MHVLFVHRAFPAQFGRLALELTRRHGWKCSVVAEHLSRCPAPSPAMLEELDLHLLPATPGTQGDVPWARSFGAALERGRTLFEYVRATPALRPDLVVGHAGLLPTLFLREILPCPFVDYCEYYFAPDHADLTYRIDLPEVEPAPFYPRCINAATLLGLASCEAGLSPTCWQRDSFPERFRRKIEVHFDGVDTELYRPRQVPRSIAGRPLPDGVKVVTYVARGLESIRGFDLFLRLAAWIRRERSDVLFVVTGDAETYYGWDRLFTGGSSFKEWAAGRTEHDPFVIPVPWPRVAGGAGGRTLPE
jgi:glycosyltransferase involved in cell wall biosynthesis